MATNSWRNTIPQEHRYLETVASQNLFYGTAWKGECTADLVYSAIKAGFRSIATAAQPKHYREDLVGEGVRRAIRDKIVTRKDLYIQTTFTPFHSQDEDNCPYDANLGIAQQVNASIEGSRQHFANPDTDTPGYLNAVVLHDLYPSVHDNVTAWESMSSHMGQASVRRLGLSNVDKADLEWFCAFYEQHSNTCARPLIVQNRFHQRNDYDAEVRAVCKESGITYQAFGVRANNIILNDGSSTVSVADTANVSREAALYGIVMNALGCVAINKVSLDVQIVNGTSNTSRLAIVEEVQQVLMDLNDAHWWNLARLEQQRDSAAGTKQGGNATVGTPERDRLRGIKSSPLTEADLGVHLEGGAYRLARYKFLKALGIADLGDPPVNAYPEIRII